MHPHRLLDACLHLDPLHPQAAERRRHWRAGLLAFFLTCLWLNFVDPAHAQLGFDGMTEKIHDQGMAWMKSIAAAGRSAFLLLAAIELAWCAAMWAFDKDSMSGLVGDMVKSIMTIAFFFAVLNNAPAWIPAIHEQFRHVSDTTLKVPALTPDTIMAEGIAAYTWVIVNMMNPAVLFAGLAGNIAQAALMIIGSIATLGASGDPAAVIGQIIVTLVWGLAGFGLAGIAAATILICYFIIAFQLVMLQVEMYMLMAAGAVFLGLGGSRWTRDYVSKYMNHGIVVGVRFLVLMMILSLTNGSTAKPPWETAGDLFTAGISFADDGGAAAAAFAPLGILLLVLTKTLLAIKAPDMASALLTGGVGLSAGSAWGVASTMLQTASTVSGMPGAVTQAAEAMKTAGGAAGKVASPMPHGAAAPPPHAASDIPTLQPRARSGANTASPPRPLLRPDPPPAPSQPPNPRHGQIFDE